MINVTRPFILLLLRLSMSAYNTLSFADTPRESVDAQVEQGAVVKVSNKQIEKYRELNPAEQRLVNQPYTVTGLARDVATTLIIDTRDEAYRVTQERYGHQDVVHPPTPSSTATGAVS